MERYAPKHFLSHIFAQFWTDYKKNVEQARNKSSTDNIHDLRVSIQHLEAALRLSDSFFFNHASSDKLLKSLEQTRKKLGPLRDLQVESKTLEKDKKLKFKKLDVHIANNKSKVKEKTKKFLSEISLSKEKKYFDKVAEKIASIEDQKSTVQLRQLLEHKVDDLYILFKQAMTKSSAPNYNNLHQIRRIAKQLRYQEELMKSMFGRTQINIKKLKKVQTALGELQDDNVLIQEIDQFLGQSKKASNVKIADYQIAARQKVEELEKTTFKNLSLMKWEN